MSETNDSMFSASSIKRLVIVLVALAVSVGLDQITKIWAIDGLRGKPQIAWGQWARLTYAENAGAFLGLGKDWPQEVKLVLFIGLALVATVVAVYFLWRKPQTRMMQVGITLFAGGALGNLIDRIFRDGGRVVDFMQMGIPGTPLQTGVFNVADIFLMAAIPFFLFGGNKPKKKKKTKPAADDA